MNNQKTILYCPLDWGLGHATRGIPLIRNFLHGGNRVILASANEPLVLLREEFPGLEWIRLPSYRIRYTRRIPLWFKLFLSIPGIVAGTVREHRRLKKILMIYPADLVVSDNRYGLWNKDVVTVFISHQISVKLPAWLSWGEYLLYRLNVRQIRRFNHLWIPDHPGEDNLTGELTGKYSLPGNARFIGILSRFLPQPVRVEKPCDAAYDIVAILSGPEPQRTILEQMVCRQLIRSNLRSLVIRGIPSLENPGQTTGKLTRIAHLPGEEMKQVIRNAKYIISRPGYSTIMDLIALNKTAILIPTPGQTEQEYLGKRMHEKKFFLCMKQRSLNLEKALEMADGFSIRYYYSSDLLDQAFREVLTPGE